MLLSFQIRVPVFEARELLDTLVPSWLKKDTAAIDVRFCVHLAFEHVVLIIRLLGIMRRLP